MKVNMGQIESGIIKYIDEEFVQKTDGLLKFAIVAAIELNAPKFENLMLKVSESSYIRALDLIDKDGLIELDPLKESLLKAIEKTAQNEKGAQWFCDMAKSRMSQFHEAKKKAMEMTNDKAVLADAMMAATMQKADEIQWYMDKMR